MPTPTASHVAIASGVNHRVTSPRWTSARSYAGQFPTRYFVLYLGCTLDVTSRSCPFGRHDGQGRDEHLLPRTNATIRQGSAYLRRRSPCHARGADQLRGHVELLRCYYNFIRPHRALRFGRETRTPAMQAGLVSQRLALRNIFTAGGLTRRIFVAVVHVSVTVQPTESDEAELSTRCSPSARRQAA